MAFAAGSSNSWKLWGFLILLVAFGLFAAKRWGPYPLVNASPGEGAIVAFGDSLTRGTGAPEGLGYPAQLERRLGRPILNRGVPGDTTADALARLRTDVLDENPRIVLLLLGGNDLLRQRNPDTTFATLETMIRRIQERGALVIVIGLGGTPLNPGFGGRYRALARRTGCPYVPKVLSGIFGEPSLMADSIHPNAEGYARMADKIEPVLRKHLAPR